MYVSRSVIADVSSGSIPQNPVRPTSIDRAQERRAPAGHVGVHPLAHRHPVERLRGRSRLSPPVRADLLRVAHEPADHHVEVLADVVTIAERSVEDEQAVDVALLVVRRPQVVEMQAQGCDEAPELHVPGVDELAAVLGHLPAVERPRGPASAADAVARLVEVRPDAVLLQLVRATDAREPGAHHDHARIELAVPAWTGERGERRPRHRRGGAQDARALQQVPPADLLGPEVDRLVHRERTIVRERRVHLGKLAHRAHQRCPASHDPSSMPASDRLVVQIEHRIHLVLRERAHRSLPDGATVQQERRKLERGRRDEGDRHADTTRDRAQRPDPPPPVPRRRPDRRPS